MKFFQTSRQSYIGLGVAWALFLFAIFFNPMKQGLSTIFPLQSLDESEVKSYETEVFGFLPYWNFDNTQSIDYEALTTLAYFDIKVDAQGDIVKSDSGYQSFVSDKATEIFRRAHNNGVRVVLTLTQMNNDDIKTFLDDPIAQQKTIEQSVALVKKRGIDGINIDFEYDGNPGEDYRNRFTEFSMLLTQRMHDEVPSSKVTVSVYASGVRYPKVQNIGELAKVTDGIFMMGYDFAIASSDVAMPTAPLNGYKEGKYWYDISTAVEDFLAVMPADKLILGTPWYGLNFEVYEPSFKAETVSWYYWGRRGKIQTYENVRDADIENSENNVKTGWDEVGQVGWKAYYMPETETWRMVYMDDTRSLSAKYDLVKQKGLLGVGIWAIGFEGEHTEMWQTIRDKFGLKIADIRISQKPIYEFL